jgi:exodeoxyribonuclease VII large subunit
MARVSKTQWSFAGDLFPEAGQKPTESVSELTQKLKQQLESGFADRRVAGEVSNFRLQGSGHAYFVLKDAGAQLSCVLFRGQGGAGRAALRDGAQVVLGGDITVYEPRGNYQLRVTSVEVQGVGALQAAFERLKEKLSAEGLFDAARKRPIPRYPGRIGLVTSATGAAIQDVLHVLSRRFCPEVILDPVRVQGSGAAQEIAAAIGRLNRFSKSVEPLDVILVTRGGGSLEDLWCFNEEAVARAIAGSEVPVVSAVGHEIDFTISDFVADFRAATPSAAAEILTQDWVDSRDFVESAGRRLALLAQRRLERSRTGMEGWVRRWSRLHPRRRLEARSQRLDDAVESLRREVARSGSGRPSSADALSAPSDAGESGTAGVVATALGLGSDSKSGVAASPPTIGWLGGPVAVAVASECLGPRILADPRCGNRCGRAGCQWPHSRKTTPHTTSIR